MFQDQLRTAMTDVCVQCTNITLYLQFESIIHVHVRIYMYIVGWSGADPGLTVGGA